MSPRAVNTRSQGKLPRCRRHLAAGLGVAVLMGLTVGGAAAGCTGTDLIAAMPQPARAALQAEAAAVPFSRGLVWQASKGPAQLLVVGTYHLDDTRHEDLAERLRPALREADMLLVEAGPDEQARLKSALMGNPSLTIDTSGPPLSDRLGEAAWAQMREAMAARGIPAAVAARMRPWYASVMLGMAPCALAQMGKDGLVGLDQRLIAQAGAAGVPIRALEPWDTLFTIFSGLTPEDEADLIRAALPAAGLADDMAATMANAYFDGRGWEIWLLEQYLAKAVGLQTPAEIAAQTDLVREALLDRRNRAWMAPILAAAEGAATRGKSVVVAVGLLHLPGEAGVLARLEREGWQIDAIE